jgi:hypothetical protein
MKKGTGLPIMCACVSLRVPEIEVTPLLERARVSELANDSSNLVGRIPGRFTKSLHSFRELWQSKISVGERPMNYNTHNSMRRLVKLVKSPTGRRAWFVTRF